ncbi:hypothetical protein C9374_007401 [Naegleria lovaniensis]|uniref:BTB domain-containing protein n=1 Tax=Naegleria lovaniensis TaxID=51637 RepID=A0AA88GKV8_NAELO|nr:uncharacterized protein C9374_007401 [Naegleria lovaniensis]KAG2379262.1 hypothetical protein C9374_007401 [Naegleria lovaniensis]
MITQEIPSSQKRKRGHDNDPSNNHPSDVATSADVELAPYLRDRDQVEKFRIDSLLRLQQEKERNELKMKELEILEKFNHLDIMDEGEDSTIVSSKNLNHRQPVVKEILIDNSSSKEASLENDSQENSSPLLKFKVGGKMFITSLQTINKRETMLKTMLNSDFKIDKDENGCVLLEDRNPDYFPIILEHIRTGSTTYVGLWENVSEDSVQHLKNLLEESDYFGTQKLSARVHTLIKQYEDELHEIHERQAEIKLHKEQEKQFEMQHQEAQHYSNTVAKTLSDTQEEKDEQWMNKFASLTLNEKQVIESYVQEHENRLMKEKEALKERESKLKLKSSVTFNVRGVKFSLSVDKLLIHTGSIFYDVLKELKPSMKDEIFIDRDSEIFGHIFEFLQTGSAMNIPKDYSKRKLIYKEAKEFNLKALLEHLNPLRFPIEDIGETNIRIKQEEDFIRNLFATARENVVLNDPYLHLVGVFDLKNGNKTNSTRSDIFKKGLNPPPSIPLIFNFEDPVEASELVNDFSQLKCPPQPTICDSREVFIEQFNAFSFGLFRDMNWNNVFCAGGGVLACLLQADISDENDNHESDDDDDVAPQDAHSKSYWDFDDGEQISPLGDESPGSLSDDEYFTASDDENNFNHRTCSSNEEKVRKMKKTGKRSKPENPKLSRQQKLIEYYRTSDLWKDSDIDLFLYGLTEQQAEEKIVYLYNAFKKNLARLPKWVLDEDSDDEEENKSTSNKYTDIMLMRTEHAITFKFSGLIRPVQIILRIYKSPSEVLCGFDIPCCCCGFDGTQVYCLPRAIQAINTRCNIVDPDRQSTTYEVRLVKYSLRGFRIGVPGYDAKRVCRELTNPSLYYPRRYSRRYRSRSRFSNINHVSGLARILLMKHVYINFKQHRGGDGSMLSVAGKQTLKETENSLSSVYRPSKDHDYFQVDLPQRVYDHTPVTVVFSRLQAKIKYLKDKLNKKPFFECSLNDVQEIIAPKNPQSHLSPFIEWITLEPGRQHVGSFYPHQRNFFADAYSNIEVETKRKFKYQWSYLKGRHRYYASHIKFNSEISKEIEKHYRIYKKNVDEKQQRNYSKLSRETKKEKKTTKKSSKEEKKYEFHLYTIPNSKLQINFRSMDITEIEQEGKKANNQKSYFRYSSSFEVLRTRSTLKYFKRKDTPISSDVTDCEHGELFTPAEEDSESEEEKKPSRF